jgi:hypothetical protein
MQKPQWRGMVWQCYTARCALTADYCTGTHYKLHYSEVTLEHSYMHWLTMHSFKALQQYIIRHIHAYMHLMYMYMN